jgi:hypothetical protein
MADIAAVRAGERTQARARPDTSGRIAQRIDKGEQTDFIVSTSAGVDDLIKQGKVLADSKAQVARAGVGVVVRKGAAKPDISTPENSSRRCLAQDRGLHQSGERRPERRLLRQAPRAARHHRRDQQEGQVRRWRPC